MGFSRQEYWSELPFPPPGDLPDLGSNPCLPCLTYWQTDTLSTEPPGNSKKRKLFCHGPLCDPMGCSLSDSSVPGILQARITEVGCHSLLRGSSWPRDWTQVSCIDRQIVYCLSHQGSLWISLKGHYFAYNKSCYQSENKKNMSRVRRNRSNEQTETRNIQS